MALPSHSKKTVLTHMSSDLHITKSSNGPKWSVIANCSGSEIVKLSCSALQSSGTLCIKSPKLEVFESFQSSPLGRGFDRDTNHSLVGEVGGESRSQPECLSPPQLPAKPTHLSTSLIILQCPGTDAFKWIRRPNAASKDKWENVFTQWYCTQRGTKLDENKSDRDGAHLPLSPYNKLQSILQAQNDNRIQLTSNGFTAHINLSHCGVTNDLTPSVRMEFLIAHCSMCCDAHIVNGTL